jgi:hypothetical protein
MHNTKNFVTYVKIRKTGEVVEHFHQSENTIQAIKEAREKFKQQKGITYLSTKIITSKN